MDTDGSKFAGVQQEAEANARLIAAALELYEALDTALRCCYEDSVGAMTDPDSWTAKARAALAKARGDA